MTYDLNDMLTYYKSLFQSTMVRLNCQLNYNIICWIYLLLCIKMLFRVVVIGMTYCIVCSCFFFILQKLGGVWIYIYWMSHAANIRACFSMIWHRMNQCGFFEASWSISNQISGCCNWIENNINAPLTIKCTNYLALVIELGCMSIYST